MKEELRAGHRHGSRTRSLTGTFGPIEIGVLRAQLILPEGKTTEWKSQALRAYQRRTLAADMLIREYLSGWHQHAPGAPFACRPVWRCGGQGHGEPELRKVKSDWDAWNTLAAEEPDRAADLRRHRRRRAVYTRKATSISPPSSSAYARTAKRWCS